MAVAIQQPNAVTICLSMPVPNGKINIPYSSSGFPSNLSAHFYGPNVCACSWSDLAWAAVTVGKRNHFDLMRFPGYSYWEIVMRMSTINANLMQVNDLRGNRVHRSGVYKRSDPSEKTATSYFLGLAATKLMSERYLSVPWLMHLDVYMALGQLQVVFQPNSDEKPDLVGLDRQRRWIVAEAKGRSSTLTGAAKANVFTKAKRQTQQIRTINGQLPVWRVAVASHFAGDKGDRFAIQWEDPDGQDDDAVDVPLTEEDLLREYYRPFVDLLRTRGDDTQDLEYGHETYRVLPITEADVSVGVNTRILDVQRYADLSYILGDVYQTLDTNPDENVTIGHDGIVVQLGPRWRAVNMQRQPQDRQ